MASTGTSTAPVPANSPSPTNAAEITVTVVGTAHPGVPSGASTSPESWNVPPGATLDGVMWIDAAEAGAAANASNPSRGRERNERTPDARHDAPFRGPALTEGVGRRDGTTS